MFGIVESLPSWECGLKFAFPQAIIEINTVTPFVGVWIEIMPLVTVFEFLCVTPFVGVWIEIGVIKSTLEPLGCHSLRGSVD